MSEQSTENDIIVRLESLSHGKTGVSCRDFKGLIKEFGDLPVAHLEQVITFAADQLGYWESEWMFSPMDSPSKTAVAECEDWRQIWRVCFEALSEQVPDAGELLEHKQTLISLQHAIRRRSDYNRSRTLEKIVTTILGKTSIGLNTLGFKSIAERLYVYALFPKGTVGRSID